jgi:LCP family protein required for cell wall assembly
LERAKTDPEYLKRAPEALNKQVINIFILGMDLRPGEKVGRADTIMALSFNPATNQIVSISIPRDVHSPEVTQVANESGYEGNFRINGVTAFFKSLEGPRKVIEDATGLSGDFVLQLNFQAFVELVNKIGGIDIEAEAIHDSQYPTENYGTKEVTISAGKQHMDGETALEYARSRAGPDADYGRARRSRQVAMALIEKVLARTKSNPFSIIELINLVGRLQGEGNLRLSSELSLPDMLAIAADQVTHPQDINQIKIPQVQGAVSAETVASQVRDPKDQYQIIITPGVEEPIPYWGPLRTKVKQALAAAAPTPPPSAPPAVAAPPATPAPDAGAAGGETKK